MDSWEETIISETTPWRCETMLFAEMVTRDFDFPKQEQSSWAVSSAPSETMRRMKGSNRPHLGMLRNCG